MKFRAIKWFLIHVFCFCWFCCCFSIIISLYWAFTTCQTQGTVTCFIILIFKVTLSFQQLLSYACFTDNKGVLRGWENGWVGFCIQTYLSDLEKRACKHSARCLPLCKFSLCPQVPDAVSRAIYIAPASSGLLLLHQACCQLCHVVLNPLTCLEIFTLTFLFWWGETSYQ